MDAITEGKIEFSTDEINNILKVFTACIIFSLIGWSLNMVRPIGKADFAILKPLLVSYEGLDNDQISFFTELNERNCKKFLLTSSPLLL